MSALTKVQARQLAVLFTDFSAKIAKYRYDHWEELTPTQRQKSLDNEYDLMTVAGQLNALAGVLTLEEVQDSIDQIKQAVNDAEKFLKKVSNLKAALGIIAGVLSLVMAITEKDPKTILGQLQGLQKQLSA